MDGEKGIQFLKVCLLEKQVTELEEAEALTEREQILQAKLKMLQDRHQLQMSEDELDALRFRVMSLEDQVDKLSRHISDECTLPIREAILSRKLTALSARKKTQ